MPALEGCANESSRPPDSQATTTNQPSVHVTNIREETIRIRDSQNPYATNPNILAELGPHAGLLAICLVQERGHPERTQVGVKLKEGIGYISLFSTAGIDVPPTGAENLTPNYDDLVAAELPSCSDANL